MIDTDELRRLREAATDNLFVKAFSDWWQASYWLESYRPGPKALAKFAFTAGYTHPDNALAPDMADELLWLRDQAEEMAEALEGIREMLWSRPDITNKLAPLMGWHEVAMGEKAKIALTKYREGRGDG